MQSAHEAAGATGTRRSPRPLFSKGETTATPRALSVARAKSHLELRGRHCEERSDEAIHSFFTRKNGLLRRGACHRARIRATRWLLAMTDATALQLLLPRRRRPALALLLFLLLGAVAAVEAAGGGAEHAVMAGIVTGDAADRGAFQAAFCIG